MKQSYFTLAHLPTCLTALGQSFVQPFAVAVRKGADNRQRPHTEPHRAAREGRPRALSPGSQRSCDGDTLRQSLQAGPERVKASARGAVCAVSQLADSS